MSKANSKANGRAKRKGTTSTLTLPDIDIAKLVEKAVDEQVKEQVALRIDRMILATIHGSTSLGLWCPHKDDNLIRLTEDARNHIRAEIQRSFQAEVLHQVAEMADKLEKSIKQRVDENMALFEVGQGNWVFRIMGEQIKAHVAKTLAATVKGLTIQPEAAQEPDTGSDDRLAE